MRSAIVPPLVGVAALLIAAMSSVAQDASPENALGSVAIAYDVVDGQSIPTPLTEAPGDPARGRAILSAPERGGCLACHRVAALADTHPEQGVSGPALDGVASRVSEGSLRLQIVNIGIVTPDSQMPAYYTIEGVEPVAPGEPPRPLLEAQEIEDVIAYLMTLDGE